MPLISSVRLSRMSSILPHHRLVWSLRRPTSLFSATLPQYTHAASSSRITSDLFESSGGAPLDVMQVDQGEREPISPYAGAARLDYAGPHFDAPTLADRIRDTTIQAIRDYLKDPNFAAPYQAGNEEARSSWYLEASTDVTSTHRRIPCDGGRTPLCRISSLTIDWSRRLGTPASY
ncbi:hypothetical protein SCP_1702550 [Sparassis crispa]|uniref:Uncharacterized protein n=1 Tax=Sparassis crispa TaxID=139825 RepID=A0A401H6B7_9APHY|nr:hypothetical protein SCP_1702550 [Sparassis crispa]GBE89929.1 hypothetical protein SCP_1702550 [Sparassis crispa]